MVAAAPAVSPFRVPQQDAPKGGKDNRWDCGKLYRNSVFRRASEGGARANREGVARVASELR